MEQSNLLITTIGAYNCLKSWTDGEQNFDIALLNYDYTMTINDSIQYDCVWFDSYPTFKYPGIWDMFADASRLKNYDYFFMPDEDIELSAADINKLFDKAASLKLSLCCPSVEDSPKSFPSWKHFVHKPDLDIIHTNFVEIQSPLFSRPALIKCLDTFPKSQSGWGLDIVWPKLIGGNGSNMAIINSVVSKHTRPIRSGELYSSLQKKGLSPYREKRKLMQEYGINTLSIKTEVA